MSDLPNDLAPSNPNAPRSQSDVCDSSELNGLGQGYQLSLAALQDSRLHGLLNKSELAKLQLIEVSLAEHHKELCRCIKQTLQAAPQSSLASEDHLTQLARMSPETLENLAKLIATDKQSLGNLQQQLRSSGPLQRNRALGLLATKLAKAAENFPMAMEVSAILKLDPTLVPSNRSQFETINLKLREVFSQIEKIYLTLVRRLDRGKVDLKQASDPIPSQSVHHSQDSKPEETLHAAHNAYSKRDATEHGSRLLQTILERFHIREVEKLKNELTLLQDDLVRLQRSAPKRVGRDSTVLQMRLNSLEDQIRTKRKEMEQHLKQCVGGIAA